MKLPALTSVTTTSPELDVFFEFELTVDPTTGVIRQVNPPPKEILYQTPRNSGIGKLWKNHYESFSNFVLDRVKTWNNIIEIGSGNGWLAKWFCNYFNYEVICFDPAPSFEPEVNNSFPFEIPQIGWGLSSEHECKIRIIKSFFPCEHEERTYNIVASHTFEHVEDIHTFLLKAAECLYDNGKIFLSVPNFQACLDKQLTNTISPEHLSYFTVESLTKTLEYAGFENIEIELFNDHSIFACGQKGTPNTTPIDLEFLNKITVSLKSYFEELNQATARVGKIIETNQDKWIYLFGAHMMSYIALLGNDESKFAGVVDNDPLKHSSRLYGTNLYCISPDEVPPNAIILLNGGSYHDEIKQGLIAKNLEVVEWRKPA